MTSMHRPSEERERIEALTQQYLRQGGKIARLETGSTDHACPLKLGARIASMRKRNQTWESIAKELGNNPLDCKRLHKRWTTAGGKLL